MSRFFALAGVALLAGLFVAAGCGDGSSSETPKAGEPDAAGAFQVAIASSDHAVGQQRVAFALIKDGKPLEDQIVYVRFFRIDAAGGARVLGGTAIPWSPLGVPTASGHATHADTELRGVYFANIAFDAAGSYGL